MSSIFATPTRSSSRRSSVGMRTPVIQKCVVQEDNGQSVVEFTEDHLGLTVEALLGSGGFGNVYLARTRSGELIALKESSKELSDGDRRRLMEEIRLMERFSAHPNIVRFIAAGQNGDKMFIAMERCSKMNLNDLMAHRELSYNEVLWIAFQLCSTVKFIHSKSCIHRDLKPQNLLFDFDGNLKITDFGLASRLTDTTPRKTIAGTATFMAPEMAQHYLKVVAKQGEASDLRYGKEVDVWSIGIILYVLVCRKTPYFRHTGAVNRVAGDKKARQQELFNAVAVASWNWPPNFECDPDFMGLVNRILSRDRSTRPSMDEIMDMPMWKRRPYSCPITLLQSLKVMDTPGAPRRSLSQPQSTNPNNRLRSPGREIPKKSMEEYQAEWIQSLETREMEDRAILQSGMKVVHADFMKMMMAMKNEFNRRVALHVDEKAARSRIASDFANMPRPLRNTMVNVAKNAARHTGQPRATSQTAQQVEVVPFSPTKLAMYYANRGSSTRYDLRTSVPVPNTTILCKNSHVMERCTSLPRSWEGWQCEFACDSCGKTQKTISPQQYLFRCTRCDYDVCPACAAGTHPAAAREDLAITNRCPHCSKLFHNAKNLLVHAKACASKSPSPALQQRATRTSFNEESVEAVMRGDTPEDSETPRHQMNMGSTNGRLSTGRFTAGPDLDEQFPVVRAQGFAAAAQPVKQKNRPPARSSAVLDFEAESMLPPDDAEMSPVFLEKMESPTPIKPTKSTPAGKKMEFKIQQKEAQRPLDVGKPEPASRKGKRGRNSDTGMNAPRPPKPQTPERAVHEMLPPSAMAAPAMGVPNLMPTHHHTPTPAHAASGGGHAFLNLPQSEHNRKRFMAEFLGGGWVRYYNFANNDVVLAFYCLQPGRFGALYANQKTLGTMILDTAAQRVLNVPAISDDVHDFTDKDTAHKEVLTFYNEPHEFLTMKECEHKLSPVLSALLAFITEFNRMRSEGLPPAVPAAFVQEVDATAPQEKFVYVRRMFPDPQGAFTFFRLSNLRSQIITTTSNTDVRWQGSRHNTSGMKYYVDMDGSVTPIAHDDTGLLTRLEVVLNNDYIQ